MGAAVWKDSVIGLPHVSSVEHDNLVDNVFKTELKIDVRGTWLTNRGDNCLDIHVFKMVPGSGPSYANGLCIHPGESRRLPNDLDVVNGKGVRYAVLLVTPCGLSVGYLIAFGKNRFLPHFEWLPRDLNNDLERLIVPIETPDLGRCAMSEKPLPETQVQMQILGKIFGEIGPADAAAIFMHAMDESFALAELSSLQPEEANVLKNALWGVRSQFKQPRSVEPLALVSAEGFTHNSNFQAGYRGTGQVRQVEDPRVIQSLFNMYVMEMTGSKQVVEHLMEEVSVAALQEVAGKSIWANVHSGAIKAYTSETAVGSRSLYKILNQWLNEDAEHLDLVVPLMIRMNSYLNARGHGGGRYVHGGTIGESGFKQLRFCARTGTPTVIARFLSTTNNAPFATSRMHPDRTGPLKGVLYTIHVPKGFWGARDISDISEFPEEAETLFCAHSMFVVLAVDEKACSASLAAVDKYGNKGFYKLEDYVSLCYRRERRVMVGYLSPPSGSFFARLLHALG